MMSGADELDALSHELEEFAREDALKDDGGLSDVEQALAQSLEESEEMFSQEEDE